MEDLNLGKHGATRQSWGRESARSIYIEIKTANPEASHQQIGPSYLRKDCRRLRRRNGRC